MNAKNHKQLPLLCWDIVSMSLLKKTKSLVPRDDFEQLSDFKKLFGWKVDLELLLDVPYDAIVITDKEQIIQWTNSGFKTMTGYSANYAKGRYPSFLQGDKTSEQSKKVIKNSLFSSKVIRSTLVNYRKNKEEYLCDLTIYPLVNEKEELTHFIALEKEVNAQV